MNDVIIKNYFIYYFFLLYFIFVEEEESYNILYSIQYSIYCIWLGIRVRVVRTDLIKDTIQYNRI